VSEAFAPVFEARDRHSQRAAGFCLADVVVGCLCRPVVVVPVFQCGRTRGILGGSLPLKFFRRRGSFAPSRVAPDRYG